MDDLTDVNFRPNKTSFLLAEDHIFVMTNKNAFVGDENDGEANSEFTITETVKKITLFNDILSAQYFFPLLKIL